MAKESQAPAHRLASQGKGLCGVREDSDCSAEVCVDPEVGTNGVLKGQDQRGISGRHMDFEGSREGKRGGGKLLGKEEGRAVVIAMVVERKRSVGRGNSLLCTYTKHTWLLLDKFLRANRRQSAHRRNLSTARRIKSTSSELT